MRDLGDGEALAAELASRFGLGAAAGALVPVSYGVQGHVFSLSTDSGRWAAKALSAPVEAKNVELGVSLQEAAVRAGIPAPRPVRSTAGGIVELVRGGRWRVYTWVDLVPGTTEPPGPELAAEVGATLARLHGLGLRSAAPVVPWLTTPPSMQSWNELLSRALAASAPWAERLREVMPVLRELTPIAAGTPALPTLLCHCDLIPGNAVHSSQGDLVVLDWERTGSQAPPLELGYVLSSWCLSGGDPAATATALTAAYRAEGCALPRLGVEMFASAACSWLNFARGRLTAAVNSSDPEAQSGAASLLRDPLSSARLQPLLEAVWSAR